MFDRSLAFNPGRRSLPVASNFFFATVPGDFS
jgi:hypothetical protein